MSVLRRGGIYLARLDPAKGAEIGKLRPIVVLTEQSLLDINPPLVFICPLSSRSDPTFRALHIELPARERLEKTSYALVEHCRAISLQRILSDKIASLSDNELETIIHRLQIMIGA
jgi:mRNA interferase MazF